MRKSFGVEYFFAVVLFLLVLCRGVGLSSALLPFEGWDEYNYLAVAHTLETTGRFPAPDETITPDPEFIAFLQRHPHPPQSSGHFEGIALTAHDGQTAPEGVPVFRTYFQAQHGPFYYRVIIFMKKLFLLESFEDWADAARILNVVFAAITIVLWFFILRAWLPDGKLSLVPYPAALIAASSSLFMYNSARVSNSALAIVLGTAALYVYYHLPRDEQGKHHVRKKLRQRIMLAGVAGLLTALAVYARLTAITLLPVLLAGFAWQAWVRRRESAREWLLPVCFLLAYAVAIGSFHLDNYRRTGTLTGNITAVASDQSHAGLGGVLSAAWKMRFKDLAHLFIYNNIHQGPWMFRPTPEGMKGLFAKLWWFSLLLLAIALFRRESRQRLGQAAARGWVLLLHIPVAWAALLYMAGMTVQAYGHVAVSSRYALLALPALAAVFMLGAGALSQRLCAALGCAYAALFSTTYYLVTYGDMMPEQTRKFDLRESFEFLQSHHTLLALPQGQLLAGEAVLLALAAMLVGAASLTRRDEVKIIGSESSPSPLARGEGRGEG